MASKFLTYFFLISLVFAMACKSEKTARQPNVILIYADDLGRGLLGTYGQKIIKTPHIDKLADKGIRFDNAYGCMLCAPARASLLTGMHDCHNDEWNITQAGIYKKLDKGFTFDEIKEKIHSTAMPAKEHDVFLGEVAQNAGYLTAEFGKLEWGFATTPERIERHGWDYHFGYYDHVRCHGFYPPFLFEDGKKIEIPGNTRDDCGKSGEPETPETFKERWNMEGKAVYSENIIMEKLLGFIENNNPQKTENPFFIYFPTQLPHGPVAIPEVHPDFKNNENLTEIEKEYASMVKMLDDDVGRIYSKLEELNILDNTIIIFTSDNGHEIYYSQKDRCSKNRNKSLAGMEYDNIKTKFYSELNGDVFDGNDGMAGLKRSNWEGGTRIPLFWYWKDKIQPGTVSTQMVSNYDFLNTLAEITGQNPMDAKDGISYAKTLFGKKSLERDYTVYSSYRGPALVLKGGWKLRYHLQKDIFQLYYLPNDYREENDLSEQNKEKVEKMKAILFDECGGNWNNGVGGRTVPVR
jgi:arylsulfatase A-like enzyme